MRPGVCLMGVRRGTTGAQEGRGPGFKLMLLPVEETACGLNPGEGGVQSPEAGAGVSASMPWKEQGGPPASWVPGPGLSA